MMDEKDRRILEAFAARLRQVFPEARVWAFGSRARGDAEPESDLDTCVVVPQFDFNVRKEISHIAWEVGFERDMIITTIVYPKEEFEQGAQLIDPLVKNILREGIAA